MTVFVSRFNVYLKKMQKDKNMYSSESGPILLIQREN